MKKDISSLLFSPGVFSRTVASRLSELGETAMCPSNSTDMSDVDMASIAEVELSEKFSVQGTSTRSSGGIKKVVSVVDDDADASGSGCCLHTS